MTDRKYQVFVSSTFKDLIEHRREIARTVLDLGHIPAAMEYFPAMDEDQLQYIRRIIDQCDYYVIVIAGKYGSVDKEGISYTEREYDYAREKGKFILGFPIENLSRLSREQTEDQPQRARRLESFRTKIMSSRLVKTWENIHDLDNKVTKALANAFANHPQDGWVRTPKNSNESLLEELNDLRKQNELLNQKISELRNFNNPTINNIADLSSKFSFPVRLYYVSSQKLVNKTISTDWLDIFLVFARLIREKRDSEIFEATLLMNLSVRSTNFNHKNVDFHRSILYTDTFETFVMQLIAHGLIETNSRGAYKLTQKGEFTYMDSTVIKNINGT